MTLRKKTALIIGLMFACLVLILYAILWTFLLREFARDDARHAQHGAEQALAVLSDNITNLETTTRDWAAWDDTYVFVQDGNPAYVQSNLSDTTFTTLRLNLMLFVRSSGEIVGGGAFDLEDESRVPLPEGLQAHLAAGSLLVGHTRTDSNVAGILMLPDSPLIVVSQPILPSDREGPIRGTLILGRYMDVTETERLARTTLLSLSVEDFDQPDAEGGLAEVLSSLSTDEPVASWVVDDRTISGYALVEDIYGEPVLVLRVDMDRDTYAQGLTAVRYLIAGLSAVVLLFGVVILALLEKSVLSPLARLSTTIRDIGASGNPAERVAAKGRDELATLAGTVNGMLEALEHSQRRYRNLFDHVPVGLYRTTPDGEIIDANPALAHMLGYPTVESLLQVNAASIHLTPEQREQEHAVLEREDTVRDFDMRLRRPDGALFWVQDNVRAIRDDAGSLLYYEGSMIDISQRKQVEDERESLIAELQKALSEIKALTGLLPICAACKKIRDDSGYWRQVEEYIREHSDVEFTHSICPDCARKLYPEMFKE